MELKKLLIMENMELRREERARLWWNTLTKPRNSDSDCILNKCWTYEKFQAQRNYEDIFDLENGALKF